jgi:Ca2+-binding RTX toxin-like protein
VYRLHDRNGNGQIDDPSEAIEVWNETLLPSGFALGSAFGIAAGPPGELVITSAGNDPQDNVFRLLDGNHDGDFLDAGETQVWLAATELDFPRALAYALGPPVCHGLRATIVGSQRGEILLGTRGPDVIVGRDGNDVIFGLGGDDVICGGPGDDVISAGSGADEGFGDQGNDLLLGHSGDDMLYGGFGHDALIGGPGHDSLFGGPDHDVCTDDPGANTVEHCP